MTKFRDLKDCYIIAEAGVNHNADLGLALKLCDVAKAAGADAVKFQLFDVKEQVSKLAINAPYQQKGSGKQSMIEMAKKYDLPWKAHIEIVNYCKNIQIDYLSSCCDIRAVDFLVDKLNAKSIKISSGEITNLKLLKYAAKKNKPIILSTGMANLEEIDIAVKNIKLDFNSDLILLHCTSVYPANENDINLNAITTLKNRYKIQVGYSDHTLGTNAAIASISLGAKIIEKHFTLDKKLPGPDHAMALDPCELKNYIKIIRQTENMLGSGEKMPSKEELEMKKIFRRGIISIKKISAGEIIDTTNISIKRPAIGIDAINYENVLGMKSIVDIESDEPIKWEMLKK